MLLFIIKDNSLQASTTSMGNNQNQIPTHTNKMKLTTKLLSKELPGLIKLYSDGSVERTFDSPFVPPNLHYPDLQTGVFSKDVVISDLPKVSARLYLPNSIPQDKKLPILVYFHGGAFCIESAFSSSHLRYLNSLSAEAHALLVSVEYRLAPEHPLPAAYDDSWAALLWVASHRSAGGKEPWLLRHGDFDRLFIGGDSAGANIVHNLAIKAGDLKGLLNGEVKLRGGFLSHPYFWGSKAIGKEPKENHENARAAAGWNLAYPSAPGGLDNVMFNPAAEGAPGLGGLGCEKLLVCVAGKDELRERGVWYFELVKKSGWKGEIELDEVEDEDHLFHLFSIGTQKSKLMIKRLASFLNS